MDQAKIFLEDLNQQIKINKAKSAEEGMNKLMRKDFDSIVSDYQMSQMDGLDFLKKIRDKGIDIPFIMFTGRGREEVAIQALNLGANNYIQKGGDPKVQFKLLADVIDQEVRLYRGEKAKYNLASIVESSQNAIISKDLDGYITSWNKGAEQIYGYTEEEVIGRHISIITHDEYKDEIDDILSTIKKGEVVKPYETIRKTKEGDEIYISLTVSPIENDKGEIIGASAIAQDISEKREAQEKILHLNRVLDSIRNVNQTIIRETDKEILIDQICKILTDNRGYDFSWIVLFDEEELSLISYSVLDEEKKIFIEKLNKENLPDCVFETLKNKGVRSFGDDLCSNCEFYRGCKKEKNLSVRLEYEDKIYGVLIVSLPQKYAYDQEEKGLLEEVAGDISFAFHNIDMKEKIDKEERKSKRIIDSMLDGFIIFDDDGIQTYVNDAFCKMTDYSRKELIGKSIPHPYWAKGKMNEISEASNQTKNGVFRDHELYFKRKDGTEFPVIVSPEAIKDDSGNFINYFASVKDISERKKQEVELKKLNKRLEVLFSNIPGMAYRCKIDRNYTMQVVSRGSYNLTGYNAGELIDNSEISYGEIIHPEYRDYVWNSVNKAVVSKKPFKLMYKIIDKNGIEKWVWEQGRAIFTDKGKIDALEGLILDITERKELEDRQKFLHTLLRHDLKNKVNIVHGYLQLIEDGLEDKEIVNKAIDATKKEINLIDKIRILSRIKEEIVKPVKLDMILDNVISEYRPKALEKGIEIKFEKSGTEIQGGVLLEDLFDNIIENSIIHSNCNLIKISVSNSGENVFVKIEDDGIGIRDELRDKLFEKNFSIGENAGTGLGMYLSKEIVENYGGYIESKESSLGGARFDIHLNKMVG